MIVGNTEILFIDKVEPSDEGYYVCRICNTTGGSVETVSAELTTSTVHNYSYVFEDTTLEILHYSDHNHDVIENEPLEVCHVRTCTVSR